MNHWSFKTQIYAGSDSLERLQCLTGETILIICDPFLKGSQNLDLLIHMMESKNRIEIYTDVIPDPPITHVVKGVDFADSVKPTIIIAVGGGSAIDMSKGIAYFGKKLKGLHIKKFIAIPTTSGTGSEVTSFAVITDAATQIKYPLVDDDILPDEAILTPLFVMTSPPKVTAYSGMDVLVHALEAYVATGANHFTNALAEQAINLTFMYLPKCFNPNHREEDKMAMHEASCLAGLAFNKAGLGIVHAMAHQLGGQFHVPHGLANSMLLPYVLVFNATHNKVVLEKYAKLSAKLGFAEHSDTVENQFSKLVEQVLILAHTLACPMTLSEFGIGTSDVESKLDVMSERAIQDMCFQYNPYVATKEDILSIYRKIF